MKNSKKQIRINGKYSCSVRASSQGMRAAYQPHSSIPSNEERVAKMIADWEQKSGEVASPEFIASIAAQIS